ncbi:regulatory protein RecX [Bifidobacterium xylocopae]|uniref:regulatory protein RecX n=1 Tax=Bifidobacterium xylocopae TaxID=2493119 RepID=UPI001F1FBC8D|nr:regulatory protein RecX [Bifidobacterium xylocopae]
MEDPNDEEACREAALTLLDAAARPRKALYERLTGKGYAPETVEGTVKRMEELGLVDDESYARSYLRYCLGRNLGERGALREMTRKGLETSLAERVVAQAAERGLFVDSAYELGRKLARRTRGMDPQVRKRRLWSAGGRKGHNPSLIRQVAGDLFADSHDET